MKETVDKLTIKLCKILPYDITIHEEKGLCIKCDEYTEKYCDYCMNNGNNEYLCKKKTYILKNSLNPV
ncbi:hypothetical protein JXB41_04590 [Candidatus Woesearchaeota archaeon]|nr:hypothetical protein [Candidatus Woesearchaeota archaeon]